MNLKLCEVWALGSANMLRDGLVSDPMDFLSRPPGVMLI